MKYLIKVFPRKQTVIFRILDIKQFLAEQNQNERNRVGFHKQNELELSMKFEISCLLQIQVKVLNCLKFEPLH